MSDNALPGILLCVYTGKLVGDVAAVAGGAAPEWGPAHWAVLAVGFAATVAVAVVVTRLARRALVQKTGLEEMA